MGLVMVDIPAGEFVMGACLSTGKAACLTSPPEIGTNANETPQHRVHLPAFRMGRTEVTLAQFRQFITATGRHELLSDKFMQHNRHGDNAPVVYVNWQDAQDFIGWLNSVDGGGYRLPSEAEWEYACRAGGRHKHCGSNRLDDVAWQGDNSDLHPHPVATLQANAWGLYDMSGNAWEWVQDCWHGDYTGAPTDGSAWTHNCLSADRILRGGAWSAEGRRLRAVFRGAYAPENRFLNTGFRLLQTR